MNDIYEIPTAVKGFLKLMEETDFFYLLTTMASTTRDDDEFVERDESERGGCINKLLMYIRRGYRACQRGMEHLEALMFPE